MCECVSVCAREWVSTCAGAIMREPASVRLCLGSVSHRAGRGSANWLREAFHIKMLEIHSMDIL